MSKTYVTTIIEDDEDLILPFPDSLIEDCGWNEGDVLEFRAHDGYATIRKVEDPTSVMRELEGQNETSGTK